MWRLELRWVFFNVFISDLQPWARREGAKLSGDTKPFRRVGNGDIGNTHWEGVSQCQVTRCDCGVIIMV